VVGAGVEVVGAELEVVGAGVEVVAGVVDEVALVGEVPDPRVPGLPEPWPLVVGAFDPALPDPALPDPALPDPAEAVDPGAADPEGAEPGSSVADSFATGRFVAGIPGEPTDGADVRPCWRPTVPASVADALQPVAKMATTIAPVTAALAGCQPLRNLLV